MNKTFFFLIITLLLSWTMYGQDNSSDDWRARSERFLKDSIARDLVNSDLNQLKSIALSLGLEVKDENAGAYRSLLSQFYGVKLIQEPKKSGKKITLEHASELKLLKVLEEDEETIHIIGKVRLILEGESDEGLPIQRTVEADEIFIDLKNKEIVGVKNVVFKDEQLEFKGEQFYYNFEKNRGVLFDGQTKMLASGNSGLKGAFFTGDKIVKTGEEEAVLYNGKLTSCDQEDPHYYINVSRIWISEDGEWGMLGGTIYVGPIPFFYIPIFYHPKGIDINPALGYRHREGWFFNSTYYLFGEKGGTAAGSNQSSSAGGEGPKSITGVDRMRATPVDNFFTIKKSAVDGRLNSFYDKYKFYEKNPTFRVYPSFSQLDFSSRLFLDFYTNLGFYWGGYFYFRMQDSNFPLEMALLTDYAFSRMIWKDNDSDLYLFYNPADPNTLDYPALSNPFFFRTSQWLNVKGAVKKDINFDYEFQFEYASDKSYYTDFYSRYLDFSYIDLMFEGIEYGVQSSSTESQIFQSSGEDEKAGAKNNLKTFADFVLSPKSYPDIYGLPLLSSVSGKLRTEIDLQATEIVSPYFLAPHPRLERYMLNYFTAPELTYSMTGTIFDFDIMRKMPEQARLKRAASSREGQVKQKELDALYSTINSARFEDSTSDTNVVDFKTLLPLFSGAVDKNKIFKESDVEYYDDVLSGDDEPEVDKEEKGDEKLVEERSYDSLELPEENLTALTDSQIKIFSARLTYKFDDKLNNKFYFEPNAQVSSDLDRRWDSFELLMQNGLPVDEIVKEFEIYHELKFNLSGLLSFFEIKNLAILALKPTLDINSKWSWSSPDYYLNYLRRHGNSPAQIDKMYLASIDNDKRQSEFSIYYNDTWSTDLSFGKYFLRGTGLSTNFKFRVFKVNEKVLEEFRLFNLHNPGLITFDINYYDNRELYEKVEDLNSAFTLKFNFLPEQSKHQLNYSVQPRINWVIGDSELNELKSELWGDNSGDVVSSTTWGTNIIDFKDAAKRYIYYREGSNNLNDKIRDFYAAENFWDGPMNYRSMFSDIAMTLGYSYKSNNVNYVNFTYTLNFILKNMGAFIAGGGDLRINPFTVYPGNNLELSFFDSAIVYRMDFIFTPIVTTFYPRTLTTEEKRLDEFKTMTFTNSHTFTFQLKHDSFEFKLPKDNWLKFTSTTSFKYSSDVNWAVNSDAYSFYLDSQLFSLSFIMDILNIQLNFKSINYVDSGYGFALDGGKVNIGYRFEEIPVFLKYFKLIFETRLTFDFTVKHKLFYTSNTLPDYSTATAFEYGSSFISNNSLSFLFKADLIIAEGKSYETKLSFSLKSKNSRMYQFYNKDGLQYFFLDMFQSFNFGDEQARKDSSFNLEEIKFVLEHGLHDWKLQFSYSGSPVSPGVDSGRTRYYWENRFAFQITWKLDSKNQLMKLFNKTKVDEEYKEGQWKQRILSLDPDENN